jgi:asparagine synthase (glutamine-hydrolysing)
VSAVAGCVWFDGAARSDDLRPSIEAVAHRARGAFRVASVDNVALAYAADAAETQSPQPMRDADARARVIVDGRFDNLEEIAAALGPEIARTPCAVALAAYRRWGVDAGARLLGDFVIVIHDEVERTVIAIRDPMGLRPLFYGSGPRGIVFGSEAQQVARHPAIGCDIHEPMIAEALSDAPTTINETLWRNVYRVPPAHALEITPNGPRVQRYWDFNPSARVRHATADGYADEFRHLFTQAVDSRIRGVDAVGVLLSGGIDSSSIAGVAQSLRTRASASPIHAFSGAFPGRPCDERAFADAVAERWRLPLTRRDVVLPSRADLDEEARRYLDLPISPAITAKILRTAAAEAGVRTLLTGCGGDDFFSGSPLGAMSLLARGRVLPLARAMVSPLLSDGVRRALRPILGARAVRRPWIRAEFARTTCLEERLRARSIPPFPTREQRDLYGIVRGLPQVIGDEIEDRAAHASGIDQRHPFYDRRVAEFGLALPSSERMRGGEHKIVIRRALADYLPPAIAARRDKAEFSFAYVEALAAIDAPRLFARLRSEEAGWVDGAAVRDMHSRMIGLYSRGDGAYIGLACPLWTVAALEVWLEAIGGSRGSTA